MGSLLSIDALYCIKFRNHDGFITKKEMAQVAKRLSQNQVRFWGLLTGRLSLQGFNKTKARKGL